VHSTKALKETKIVTVDTKGNKFLKFMLINIDFYKSIEEVNIGVPFLPSTTGLMKNTTCTNIIHMKISLM